MLMTLSVVVVYVVVDSSFARVVCVCVYLNGVFCVTNTERKRE